MEKTQADKLRQFFENIRKERSKTSKFFDWSVLKRHNKQIIIAVEGISGAGKTTTAKYIADKLGATAILCDQIIPRVMNMHLEQLQKLYNKTINCSDEYHMKEFFVQVHCKNEDPKRRIGFFDIIRDSIEKKIYEIMNFQTNQKIFVIDIITSSKFEKLWNDANFRILVDADKNYLKQRRAERKAPQDTVKNVDEINEIAFRPTISTAKKVNFYINNNGTLEELHNQLDSVIYDIIEQVMLLGSLQKSASP